MITNENLIFIVDDDELWAIKLEQLLNDLGYTNTRWFETGSDCIVNMHELPTVVFLDFQMEGLDGLDVLQQIKAISTDTEVVFCTSLEDITIAIKAIQYGSEDYLLKRNANQKELKRIFRSLKIS